MNNIAWPIIIFFLLPFHASSQDMARVQRAESAFQAWVQAAGIGKAAIAVGYEGAFVHAVGIGQNAGEPADVASLSKAITAMCLADVLSENGLTYEMRIGDALEGLTHEQSANLTIAQFVSQGSGLDEDETQDHMWRWVGEGSDRHQDAAMRALSRGPIWHRSANLIITTKTMLCWAG